MCFSPSGCSLLAATPLWASNYIVRLAITIAMFTALALSWNFIGGFTGYPSFSTAAFFGLGCYAGALSQRAGVPMVLAWGIATIVVGAFAAGLGAIILRMRGHYFAIGSIGIVEVIKARHILVGQRHRRWRRSQSAAADRWT